MEIKKEHNTCMYFDIIIINNFCFSVPEALAQAIVVIGSLNIFPRIIGQHFIKADRPSGTTFELLADLFSKIFCFYLYHWSTHWTIVCLFYETI